MSQGFGELASKTGCGGFDSHTVRVTVAATLFVLEPETFGGYFRA